MIRTFETHEIRKQKELTGSLWSFSPCQGENAGRKAGSALCDGSYGVFICDMIYGTE